MLARTFADDITQENNLLLYLEITQSLANYNTIREKLGGLQTYPEIGFVSEFEIQIETFNLKVVWENLYRRLTLIREFWKKSKVRDHHRACFAEKIQSAAMDQFVCVSVLWIFFPENTLGHGPKKWHIFFSAWHISSHIGICHLKFAP